MESSFTQFFTRSETASNKKIPQMKDNLDKNNSQRIS